MLYPRKLGNSTTTPAIAVCLLTVAAAAGCEDHPADPRAEPVTTAEYLAIDAPELAPGELGVMTRPGALAVRPVSPVAVFLAIDTEPMDSRSVAMMADPGVFGGPDRVPGDMTFWSDGREILYFTRPLTSLVGEGGDTDAVAAQEEDDTCTLGADYYKRPSWWQFWRNTEMAQVWTRYGDCVDGLLLKAAETPTEPDKESFVAMCFFLNEEEGYWDHTSWLECPD